MEAEKTPVLLLHGSTSVDLARELLDYHKDRPFLDDELLDYLQLSVETDERLHRGRSVFSDSKANGANGDRNNGNGGTAEAVAARGSAIMDRVRDWYGTLRVRLGGKRTQGDGIARSPGTDD